jgi:AraC-like DNA-binding protein
MSAEDRYTRFVMERVKSPPLTSGATLHWDGLGAALQSVGLTPVSEPGVPAAWLALAPPLVRDSRASPAVLTHPVGLILSPLAPAMEWALEVIPLSVYLHPGLLLVPGHNLLPGTTGELIWVPWQPTPAAPTLAVHPALLVHTAVAALQGECVEVVLHLPRHDPLHHHIALVLQAAVAAEDQAGQLYAEVLANALVVHVLRRYAAARPVLALPEVTGGLAPYKLQRTLAYIQAHLAENVSLATLAAVAQMSPTHFAHLFKDATGLAPHQYMLRCRMEQAKRLLTETDLSLTEIGHHVGCADHSHFTALFRKHATMTPKAYRSHTRSA